MTEENQVIDFAERTGIKFQAEGSEELDEKTKGCTHLHRIIHVSERTVRCRECSSKLEPFDVLLANARDWERRKQDLRRLCEKLDRKRKDMDVLARLEKNARARLGKLTGKRPKMVDQYVYPRKSSLVAHSVGEHIAIHGEGFDVTLTVSEASGLARELEARCAEQWRKNR